MRVYRPSNKIGILGLPMMLIGALLSGALIGGIAFFISYQFNLFLICVFPLIMGFAAGAIMIGAVKFGKVRSPLLAALFGLIAGIAVLGVFRGAEYYFAYIHDDAMRQAARQNRDASDQEVALQSIPIGLQEINGDDFIEFNQRLAELGTSITYRGNDIDLDQNMTLILWVVEALSIVLISIAMPFSTAKDPFDEKGNRWYGNWQWFASVPIQKRKELLDLLKQGDFKTAGALMTIGTLALPRIDIMLTGDDTDAEGDWLLKIEDVKPSRNGSQSTQITVGLLSPQDLDMLRSTIPGKAKIAGM